jgi:succinoglycan biosynthesis protein ExoA
MTAMPSANPRIPQDLQTLERTLIVIPCLNEEAHLPGLLALLLAQSGPATIVVADGGSTDDSRAIVTDLSAKHPNLFLLDNPRRIQSAAVNLAVKRFGASHRWLVRIDAHCLYPDHYAATLIHAAQETGATSVVVPMITRGLACFQRGVAAAQNSRLGTGGSAHRHLGQGQWIEHGHHALFDLALYCRAGGYDEGFSHNEDAELDKRLLDLGGRIWLEPAGALTYFPRSTPMKLLRQYYGYGFGRARNAARHRTGLRLRQAAPLPVAPFTILGVLALMAAAAAPVAGLFAIPMLLWLLACGMYGAALGLKERSACIASSGLAFVMMHLGWSMGFWHFVLTRPVDGGLPEAIEPIISKR